MCCFTRDPDLDQPLLGTPRLKNKTPPNGRLSLSLVHTWLQKQTHAALGGGAPKIRWTELTSDPRRQDLCDQRERESEGRLGIVVRGPQQIDSSPAGVSRTVGKETSSCWKGKRFFGEKPFSVGKPSLSEKRQLGETRRRKGKGKLLWVA